MATIMMLPGATASQCLPAVRETAIIGQVVQSSGLQTALCFGGIVIIVVLACCAGGYLQRTIGQLTCSTEIPSATPRPQPRPQWSKGALSRATQTEAIQVRRYWDELRDSVISLATRRCIPGASRPRATRTELASLLVEQDMGRCFDSSQGYLYRN